MSQSRRDFLKNVAAGAAAVTAADTSSGENLASVDQALEPGDKEFEQEWLRPDNDRTLHAKRNSRTVPDKDTSVRMTGDETVRSDASMLVGEEHLYIANRPENNIIALNRQDGSKEWEFEMPAQLFDPLSDPSISNDSLYIVDLNGNMAAVDRKNGDEIHTESLPGSADTYPMTNGNIVTGSTGGEVTIFDEELNQQAQFDKENDANIRSRTIAVTGDNNVLYAEGGHPDSHLTMLSDEGDELVSVDLSDEGPTHGATLFEGVDVSGEVVDLYVYNDSNETIARRADNGDEFGELVFSFDDFNNRNNDRTSPLMHDGVVFGGTRGGDFYGVDIESGDGVVLDEVDVRVTGLVADSYTIAVGGQEGVHQYDLHELAQAVKQGNNDVEPVETIEEINKPFAVADGELYGIDLTAPQGNEVKAIQGDYRDIPEPEIADLSVVNPTSVYGDDTTAQSDVENSERADYFELEIETQDENWKNQYTDLSEIDLNEPIFEDMDNPGPGTYEVTVRAYQEDNIVDEKTVETTLEELNHDITRK